MYTRKKLNFLGFNRKTGTYFTEYISENRLKIEHLEFAEHVLTLLYDEYQIPKHLIVSRIRKHEVVLVRDIFIHFLGLFNLTLEQRGTFMASDDIGFGKDYASILNATRRFNDRIKKDRKYSDTVLYIKSKVKIPKKVYNKTNLPYLNLPPIPFYEKSNRYSRNKIVLSGISVEQIEVAEKMLGIISRVMKLQQKDIVGFNQKRRLVDARRIYIYFLKRVLQFSFGVTGRFFSSRKETVGAKDHSTIHYSLRMHDKLVSHGDKRYKSVFEQITAMYEGRSFILSNYDIKEYFFIADEFTRIAILNGVKHVPKIGNTEHLAYTEMLVVLKRYKVTDPVITNTLMRNPQFFVEKKKRELIPSFAT